MDIENVVVVGPGQAGFSVCSKLRELGFTGRLTLVGDETHAPYQRPPLSKAYLLGDMALDRLFFRPESYYDDANIDLITNMKVTQINRNASCVELSDGRTIVYDRLVLATGSSPIQLPASVGGDLSNVFYMRDLADADGLAKVFKPGACALIVGGGYIGLEAAAVAVKCGVETVLVEAAERILQRVASAETSDYFRALHTTHGVSIHEGMMLKELIGDAGRVIGAKLADGSEVEIDLVVVGVVIRPNKSLAEDAELTIENGIAVNAFCETSDPKILATGDCASFPHHDGRLRLESVGNAIDMAEIAAHVIMGNRQPYRAKPWFWSDQYESKLQIVGLSAGYDEIVTRRVDRNTVSFWYYKKDQLLAIDAMNDPRAYMVAKRLIENGKTAEKTAVANPEVNLKSLLKA